MRVADVTRIDSRRQKVTLDNEYVFSLYNSEIRKYNIEAGTYMSQSLMTDIENDVLYPRAKERVLYLLGSRDRTIRQVKDKLKDNFYPESIIQRVVDFVCEYGYLDDERYTKSYIKAKERTKSRRQLECELLRKGIDRSIIKSCICDEDDEVQLEAIRNWLEKPRYHKILEDTQSRGKVVSSLMRRGFEYELIAKCMDEIGDKDN